MKTNKDVELLEEYYKAGKYAECLPLINSLLQQSGLSDEQTAFLLFRKGFCLEQTKTPDESIVTYDELITRFEKSKKRKIQDFVVLALFNKGTLLGKGERLEDAIVVYDELMARFKESPLPNIQVQVAKALLYKGVCLGRAERFDEELSTYDELLPCFIDSKEPELQVIVVKTMFNKGVCLGKLEQQEKELAAYNELITRFRESKKPEIQVQIAKALFNKSICLGQEGKHEEELATYNKLITRFRESKEPEIQVQIAKALFNKSIRLGQEGKHKEELATYNKLITRFRESKEPEIQVQVAFALFGKVSHFIKTGKHEKELAAYNELITRFRESNEPEIQLRVAIALLFEGIRFRETGKYEKELATYNELITCLWESKGPGIQVWVAYALSNKYSRFDTWVKPENAMDDFKVYLELKILPDSWGKLEHLSLEQKAKWLHAVISIFEKCNDEICNSSTKMQGEISHFTSIEALYSILGYNEIKDKVKEISVPGGNPETFKKIENCLRGYNAIYMNDPNEGRILVEYSHQNHDKGIPDLTEFFKDEEHRWVEHDAAKSVYCISFTAQSDSLSLWRAYGRDGKGVCITISPGILKRDEKNHLCGEYIRGQQTIVAEIDDGDQKAVKAETKQFVMTKASTDLTHGGDVMPENLYKVQYISSSKESDRVKLNPAGEFLKKLAPHIDIIKKIKATLRDEKGEGAKETIRGINHAVREALAGVLYLFKDKQFAAEEEYRMITLRRIDGSGIFFDEDDIPRLYVKTRKFVFEDSATKIILGPTMEQAEAVQLSVQRILALNPKFASDIEVRLSGVKYRSRK